MRLRICHHAAELWFINAMTTVCAVPTLIVYCQQCVTVSRESSKKVYYEQYQLREEGGAGDAGGKLEAANMPDQDEGDRAERGEGSQRTL